MSKDRLRLVPQRRPSHLELKVKEQAIDSAELQRWLAVSGEWCCLEVPVSAIILRRLDVSVHRGQAGSGSTIMQVISYHVVGSFYGAMALVNFEDLRGKDALHLHKIDFRHSLKRLRRI